MRHPQITEGGSRGRAHLRDGLFRRGHHRFDLRQKANALLSSCMNQFLGRGVREVACLLTLLAGSLHVVVCLQISFTAHRRRRWSGYAIKQHRDAWKKQN